MVPSFLYLYFLHNSFILSFTTLLLILINQKLISQFWASMQIFRMWKLFLVISIKCASRLQVNTKKKKKCFKLQRDKDNSANHKYVRQICYHICRKYTLLFVTGQKVWGKTTFIELISKMSPWMRHYWLNITCLNNLDILNNVTAKVNTVNKWLYCRTLIRSRPIRPLWWSTFRTRTSTRSPGPSARLRRRWLTGSLSGVMLLLWMSPERPTPISTKAPNRAVLSTRPVNTVPTRRSLIDTMPCLKSACPKSEDGRERKRINEDLMPFQCVAQ